MIKPRSNDRPCARHATTKCDQSTAEWRCAARRVPIAALLLLFTLGCWGGSTAIAQDRHHTRREQNPNSALRKLDLLQQSVKQKLKNALGVKGQHDSNEDAQGSGADGAIAADDRHAQTHGRSSGNGVIAQAGNPTQSQVHPKWTPQPTSPAGAEHPRWVPPNSRTDDGSRAVAAAAENRWQPERYTEEQYYQESYARQPYQQQPYPHEQYAPAQYASPNPMRAAEPAEQHAVGPAAYNQIQRPLPPPIADLATGELPQPAGQPGRGPTRRWDGQRWDGQEQGFADPRYSNSSEMGYRGEPSRLANASVNTNAPLARGSVLGDNQITATQHALRLLEENGDLKAKLAMLDAENKRLKEKLDQTETLLGRSTKAVEGAYEEIEATRQINRELQTKLDDAEQKYNRYLMETDRMLQSIREELDDVLVREISANGT
ncbi:hypothetical protein Enr13x_39830 [Stieleria neptunia]|uniref:Uncharacterized protein n=1 Tax=Stieleria neptunia TaxID=2527979 RepID=A0A518HTG8_9BACT|nr:hypothetical protein [Stieleria neptunia]QDV44121.1 hypothetical protein Enr13x_39830 [Stieleria neptunia]